MAVQVESWSQLGHRVAAARAAVGLTQAELASRAGMERTAVSKIETGSRKVDALELVRLADGLGHSVDWFITESAPALVSRRAGRLGDTRFPQADVLIERLARDVELLVELGTLRIDGPPTGFSPPASLQEAEAAASRARSELGHVDGPLVQLQDLCQRLGLLAFGLELTTHDFDGAYVALESAGVALVAADARAGRKRFTLAHELGHHLFADDYATDVAVTEATSDREKLINAFAVHLLMPRASFKDDWHNVGGPADPWAALLALSVQYRVSWTAACAQAARFGLVSHERIEALMARKPTRADYLEAGLYVSEELIAPALPSAYAQAVLRAYRRQKLSADRALEMLHGAVTAEELPPVGEVPIEALRGELDPLG